MAPPALLHALVLVATFGSVSLGTYGLLRQLALSGLLPAEFRGLGPLQVHLAHELGQKAIARHWFHTLRHTVQRDLTRARRVDVTPEDFVGAALLNGIGAAAVVWVVTLSVGGSILNVVPALVAGVVAFQVPAWNLSGVAGRRASSIGHRLPYSLEVIVLATEAGAGFEESLAILVREDARNPLHEEFDQVLRDMELGRKRREALHAMAERVKTEDLTAFVLALDISEELGTEIGETLRKQSEVIRTSRLHRAERLAREAGPKMALPNTMIMVANILLILAPFLPKLANFSGM